MKIKKSELKKVITEAVQEAIMSEDWDWYESVEEIFDKYFQKMLEAWPVDETVRVEMAEASKEFFMTALNDAHQLGKNEGFDEGYNEATRDYTAEGDYEADRAHERDHMPGKI